MDAEYEKELLGLPVALIKENIVAQIGRDKERSDYLTTILYQIDSLRTFYEHDEDMQHTFDEAIIDICSTVVERVCEVFDVHVDISYSNIADTRKVAEELYDIVVVNHKNFLKDFVMQMIDNKKSDIVDYYGTVGRDVTSISVKSVHKSKRARIITSNIPEIVDSFLSDAKSMDPIDFIDIADRGSYSWFVVREMYENGVMFGNFMNMYTSQHFFSTTINDIKSELYYHYYYMNGKDRTI